ncbi:hypothetical protein [Anaerospora hongkongensis]|uniref:hypothetical protein n=1 Tax=Anaerospora hongkongensis TaxID=244830 RepID=UPI00289EC6BC|nr:hypothetical protein [Anaerospora hongkongensis]
MIHPPKEILHLLYYDEKTNDMAINEAATEEEKRIFKQFLQDVKDGTISDVNVNF